MSDTIKKLKLRNSYPVDPADPDGVKVRALRMSEVSTLTSGNLTNEQKTGFILGCGLLGDNDMPFFDRGAMSAAEFADHVLRTAEISMDWLSLIVEAINRVTNPQKPEDIAKN